MMFGFSKIEKNEKATNRARIELSSESAKEKGHRLSKLRKLYPSHLITDDYFFEDDVLDYQLILLYVLLLDDPAVEEADLFDSSIEESILETEESIEEAVVAEEVEEVAAEPVSFDSSTPSEDIPSSDERTSFSNDTDRSSYGGDDSGGSCDSGGDCGGCD